MRYDLVVGLETHVEQKTKTKIFCNCANKFGSEPNTNCCPICLGHPGTLPKLNEKVVNFAIRAGLALNCEVNLISKNDEKFLWEKHIFDSLAVGKVFEKYD